MARKLIERLPKYYRGSSVMRLLMGTDEAALDAVEEVLDSTADQCLIATADDSLSRWEQAFGIPASQEPNERRRERILARKRGGGTGTVAHLKSVISSFTNGIVEVTELYSQYMITIKFVGIFGAPPYIEDVKAAIEDIIPAHIGYSILIIYHTWGEISGKRWSDIANKTWKEISEGDLNA